MLPNVQFMYSTYLITHNIFDYRKQREATSKEAMELDEEMERMQSHTQFKLEEQVCYQLTHHVLDFTSTIDLKNSLTFVDSKRKLYIQNWIYNEACCFHCCHVHQSLYPGSYKIHVFTTHQNYYLKLVIYEVL